VDKKDYIWHNSWLTMILLLISFCEHLSGKLLNHWLAVQRVLDISCRLQILYGTNRD
jgi:hypothetical protein